MPQFLHPEASPKGPQKSHNSIREDNEMARGKSPSGGFGFDPSKMANDPTMSELMKRLAGAGTSKPRRELDPEELLEEWQDGIDALIDSHPLHKQKLGEKVKGSVELKTVNRDRGCELVLRCGASTYRAKWDFSLVTRNFSAMCNCGHADLCEHTFFMARKLEAMLEDPQSELVLKILGEDLQDRQLKQTLSLLQVLARNAQVEQTLASSAPVEEKPLSRFVWDISVDPYYRTVSLKPICTRQYWKHTTTMINEYWRMDNCYGYEETKTRFGHLPFAVHPMG